MRRVRQVAPLFFAATVATCTSSGPRPLAASAEEVLRGSTRLVWTAALEALTDQGLPLRHMEAEDGVIETDYVDIVTYRPEAGQYPRAERLVRFIVRVGPNDQGEGTRLAYFGVYSPFSTGLDDTRRNERAIPRDHPAMSLIREMVAKVRETVEQG